MLGEWPRAFPSGENDGLGAQAAAAHRNAVAIAVSAASCRTVLPLMSARLVLYDVRGIRIDFRWVAAGARAIRCVWTLVNRSPTRGRLVTARIGPPYALPSSGG